jgi:hypothetical protein
MGHLPAAHKTGDMICRFPSSRRSIRFRDTFRTLQRFDIDIITLFRPRHFPQGER